MLRIHLLLLLPVIAVCATPALAQPVDSASSAQASPRNIDGSAFGERIDITPVWLFTPTDNPAYASPGFDDSSWTTVSTSRELLGYGFHDFPYCWYRVHVHLHLPPHAQHVMLALTDVSGQYQAFVNGIRVGGASRLFRHVVFDQVSLAAYPIPESVIDAAHGDLVVALRFSTDASGVRGRGTSIPISTYSDVLLLSRPAAAHDASYVLVHRLAVYLVLAALSLVVGLVSLSLFFALRNRREYLAIAIYMLAYSGYVACIAFRRATIATIADDFFAISLFGITNVFLIEFVRLVLGRPRSRALAALEIASFIFVFMAPLDGMGWDPYKLSFIGFFIPILIVAVVLPILLARGWMRGNREAGILLPSILLLSMYGYWDFFHYAAYYAHLTPTLTSPPSLTFGTFQVSLESLGNLAFCLTILLFLVLRTVRIARERARVAAEIEAAQSVQQLLLARSSEPTPGFDVESVYLPASEVGGDFFLVSPAGDGSLTAIVGDVSGKGLTAAMRVSMILGVLRREESREPAAILRGLNQALLAQDEMGFTTACCVHLERDGRFAIANAGHISPYMAGQELETAPALPLGLDGDENYTQITGQLAPGGELVLMSDGVVEARTAKGELYGFDRLAALTLHSARQIAETAQRFGQEDDITVLTLGCAA